MARKLVIVCPSCHSGTQEPHCGSPSCTWRLCRRCELALATTADGRVRAILDKRVT